MSDPNSSCTSKDLEERFMTRKFLQTMKWKIEGGEKGFPPFVFLLVTGATRYKRSPGGAFVIQMLCVILRRLLLWKPLWVRPRLCPFAHGARALEVQGHPQASSLAELQPGLLTLIPGRGGTGLQRNKPRAFVSNLIESQRHRFWSCVTCSKPPTLSCSTS